VSAPVSPASTGSPSSAAVFLVLRRMRIPLIVLIVIFSISVLGLSVIEGESPTGPWRMSPFDSFYFMSYTATTIGFGEIPQAFNDAQRMWVTLSIYLSVIGWAYAIGTLLALLQEPTFKRALAVQRFRRRVRRLREPFWLMVGHGQTGELLGQWLDQLGRRFVAIDLVAERVDALELGSYQAEVPALAGDARNPDILALAGLGNPSCAGVIAITDDDEANLAVTMAVAVLRPELPVIARSTTPAITRRMTAFGSPTVINPFDRFGDHFRVELRAPASEQLTHWLMREPGAPLPERQHALERGPWIVCGYGRFGSELARDLRADGLDVVIVDADPSREDPSLVRGDGTEPGLLEAAGIADAVGFVAGTDNDITNLSLIAAARRAKPALFVVARQNQPTNADLFTAMDPDLLMIPTEVVAQEALAHIGTPLLEQFLQLIPGQGDAWASALISRIVLHSGEGSPELWRLTIDSAEAPAIARWLQRHPVRLGDLLRDPMDRDQALGVTALMAMRGDEPLLAPADDVELQPADVLLLAGDGPSRRALETSLMVDSSAAYVLTGRQVPSGWLWSTLAGGRSARL
jgi:voltage-gated potassium channel